MANSAKLPKNTQASIKKLQHDSARLEAVFASIGEGVLATDENGTIIRVNQVAMDLLGYERSDLIGKHFLSVVISVRDNGKPVDVFDRPIVKAFQTGKSVSARTLYLQKDGGLLPVQVTVSPIVLNGRPIGAIEVFRDLTAEIESDKLKSDFISIASHQLRTPLSAINMYGRMLNDGMAGELADGQKMYIETILKSVERMNVLIDTLLNITRLEAGGISVKPQPVRLDDLSREMLTEFVPAAEAKQIKLTSTLPNGMQPYTTDNLLVKEICANLLSNAIKYTPDGGKVHMELRDSPDEIQWIVTDTGYGIPKNEQKNIFLKFFRAENITDKDVSGTGLGLYLIKNVAEALGGDLWFESAEDKGSTFHFLLPKTPAPSANVAIKTR
jgi:PAS domain S-box-containing protein